MCRVTPSTWEILLSIGSCLSSRSALSSVSSEALWAFFFFLILNFFERIILGVNYWESRDLTVSPGHTLKERGSLSSSLMTVRDGCTWSAVGCVNLEAVAVPCRRRFHMVTRGGFFLWFPKAPGVFKQRPPISIAPSSPLLPLHEEVEALLFLSEGKPYLLEVCPCSTNAIFLLSVFFFLRKKNTFCY